MFWIWLVIGMGILFLISPRSLTLLVTVFIGLIAWNWIYDPELQDYKRAHPEWAHEHPEASKLYCFSKSIFIHNDPKCDVR